MRRRVPFVVAVAAALAAGPFLLAMRPSQAAQPAPQAAAVVPEPHDRTSSVADGRFEIVQSTIAARLTLRVDRYAGVTYQMMQLPDSMVVWQPMIRLPHREPDVRVASRANYQVFTSGHGLTFTFLINANTGATWQLKEDPKQGWYWDPIG
jgi:hypothetical protein